jgi:hypothetical protein
MAWIKTLWLTLWWWFVGGVRSAQLQDTASDARNEAEEAVARIVYESDIAPDCVCATVVHGGCAILVKHDTGTPNNPRVASEIFIHRTYALAAEKALEWLHNKPMLRTGTVSKHNRQERRASVSRRRRLK